MLVQSSGLFHVVCLKCLFGGRLISIVQGGLGNAVAGELVFRWQGEAIRHNRLIRLLGFFIHRMKWDGKCLFSTENSRNGLGDCVHARRSWAVGISLFLTNLSQKPALRDYSTRCDRFPSARRDKASAGRRRPRPCCADAPGRAMCRGVYLRVRESTSRPAR